MLADEEREYHGAYAHEWHSAWRRISWGAIFAGFFVTLALFLTLQMLGAGIGLATIDPATGGTPSASTLGIGAAIWWLVIGLISLFIGGWVAGRLGWLPHKLDRLLHGLTVWAFFYIAMFYMLTTALSVLVGGGLSVLGDTVSAAGQAAGQVAGSEPVQQTAQQALQGLGVSPEAIQKEIVGATQGDPQQARQTSQELASAVNEYFKGSRTEQDRQQLAQQIAQTTGMTQAQADQTIRNLEQQTQQAKEQAVETGEEAANVAGTTFILVAISMLLGAAAASLGGLAAPSPKPWSYTHDHAAERAGEHTYASR